MQPLSRQSLWVKTKSFDLSCEDAQDKSDWSLRIKGELANAQNPLHTFPRNSPVDEEVAYLLPTGRCNRIWETTRHSRHNGLLPAPTLMLWTCRNLYKAI